MDYSEFRRHLGKAGLSVGEFASLIEIRPASVSNYRKKPDVPRSYAVIAVVLGHIADNGGDFRALLTKFEINTHPSGQVTRLDDFRKRATKDKKK